MKLRSSKAGNARPLPRPPSTTSTTLPPKSLSSLLLSHLQSGRDSKRVLRGLYGFISLSLDCEASQDASETRIKTTLDDLRVLSGILFKELYRKLLSGSSRDHPTSGGDFGLASLHIDPSSGGDFGLASLHIDSRDSAEELLLLLRCCLRLTQNDEAVTESSEDAVSFLRRLYSQVISSQTGSGCCNISSSENSCSRVSLLKRMLEVYLDEVFVGRPFQEWGASSNRVSSALQSQFKCSYLKIQSVLELIAAHFILSVTGNHALQTFIDSLVWSEKPIPFHPELCLTVGLSLIKHPVVMSSPLILHSHLISLVAAIGICTVPEVGPNVSSWKTCVSAFYDSVNMYSLQISKLMSSFPSQLQTPGKIVSRPFESLFCFEIYDRVNLVLTDFDASWRARMGDMFTKTPFCFAIDAIDFIEENVYIVDESCRDHVSTFMSSLISTIVSTEVSEDLLQRITKMTLHDICFLASVLKLMSCSLFQFTCYLKSVPSCLESLSESEDALPVYPSLSGIINVFAENNFLPSKVQRFIDKYLKTGLSTYGGYKLLFVHFAGFLSLCIFSGLDVLVKGCLFLMLVVLNILHRLEGGSESLRPPTASGTDSSENASSPLIFSTPVAEMTDSLGRVQESIFTTPGAESTDFLKRAQKPISGLEAASNYQRARQSLLRYQTAIEVPGHEVCNGEAYLRHLFDNEEDIADLADFIEVKPEKDYSAWLSDRAKYRFRRLKKLKKQRRKLRAHYPGVARNKVGTSSRKH